MTLNKVFAILIIAVASVGVTLFAMDVNMEQENIDNNELIVQDYDVIETHVFTLDKVSLELSDGDTYIIEINRGKRNRNVRSLLNHKVTSISHDSIEIEDLFGNHTYKIIEM